MILLLLVFMQLTRDLFAIAKFLLFVLIEAGASIQGFAGNCSFLVILWLVYGRLWRCCILRWASLRFLWNRCSVCNSLIYRNYMPIFFRRIPLGPMLIYDRFKFNHITHAHDSRVSKAFSGVCVCVRVCMKQSVCPHQNEWNLYIVL